jgi:DNA repair photolyase
MEYISIETKNVLRRSKGSAVFQCGYSISPYKGCEYGCVYCPGHLRGDSFDKVWVTINSAEVLKKELKSKAKGVVCLTGYQPAERIYRVIQKTLNVLSSRHYPVHVITRSDIILDDLDIIKKIGVDSWCTVSFFLPTQDNKIARIFEPEAPTPKERIKAIRKFIESGVRTGIIMSPVIPFVNDSEEHLRSTIKGLADLKVDYVVPMLLVLKDEYRSDLVQTIKRHYPKLLMKYKKLYELGPQADIRYSRRILRQVNKILEEEGMSKTVPQYSEGIEQKQLNLENYLDK